VPSEDYTLSTPWLDITCIVSSGGRGLRDRMYFFPHIGVGSEPGTYTPNGN